MGSNCTKRNKVSVEASGPGGFKLEEIDKDSLALPFGVNSNLADFYAFSNYDYAGTSTSYPSSANNDYFSYDDPFAGLSSSGNDFAVTGTGKLGTLTTGSQDHKDQLFWGFMHSMHIFRILVEITKKANLHVTSSIKVPTLSPTTTVLVDHLPVVLIMRIVPMLKRLVLVKLFSKLTLR